jgi:hypothetical protein
LKRLRCFVLVIELVVILIVVVFVVGEFVVAVGVLFQDGTGFGYIQTFGGGLDGADYFAGARVGEASGVAAG